MFKRYRVLKKANRYQEISTRHGEGRGKRGQGLEGRCPTLPCLEEGNPFLRPAKEDPELSLGQAQLTALCPHEPAQIHQVTDKGGRCHIHNTTRSHNGSGSLVAKRGSSGQIRAAPHRPPSCTFAHTHHNMNFVKGKGR